MHCLCADEYHTMNMFTYVYRNVVSFLIITSELTDTLECRQFLSGLYIAICDTSSNEFTNKKVSGMSRSHAPPK